MSRRIETTLEQDVLSNKVWLINAGAKRHFRPHGFSIAGPNQITEQRNVTCDMESHLPPDTSERVPS